MSSSRNLPSAAAGDIKPRSVMILVEWASKAAFDSYRNDPLFADLHPHQ
jgi:heme-degrading monooxygenase HmoA